VNGGVYLIYPDDDRDFPSLRRIGFTFSSPKDEKYNCIAWAARDTGNWWWPLPETDGFWPEGIQREETLEAFINAFRTQGFEPCLSSDLEPGFEKIAIYTDDTGTPTHTARQLPNGKWTSKLGVHEDIDHTLDALIGPLYGQVAQCLKRPLTGFSKLVHIPLATVLRFIQRFARFLARA
jgi:hypothetical protein